MLALWMGYQSPMDIWLIYSLQGYPIFRSDDLLPHFWCLLTAHVVMRLISIHEFGMNSRAVRCSQLSNEKRAPGCLVYIGDEKLPSYMGIIMNHYKDPY